MNLGNVQKRLLATFTEDEVNETIAHCGFDYVPEKASAEFAVAAIILYFGNYAINYAEKENLFRDQLVEQSQEVTEDQIFNYIASRFSTIGRGSPVAGTPERAKFLEDVGNPTADADYEKHHGTK